MKSLKIWFWLNGRRSFSIRHYRSEEEKAQKLQQWKDEFLTPYNNVVFEAVDYDYQFPDAKSLNIKE